MFGSLQASMTPARLRAENTPHFGAFFAKTIEMRADARVVHRPFADWSLIGACAPLTTSERSKATALGLDPNAVYPVSGVERHVTLPVAARSKVRLGLRYESGSGRLGSAGRFRVMSMNGNTVLGGSTYLVRH
jgi:hypothetical protein